MTILDIFYRPSKEEVDSAAQILLEALMEGNITIPETFTGRWIVPTNYLPEPARQLHARTAKLGLDDIVKKGFADRYRRKELANYDTCDIETSYLYTIKVQAYADALCGENQTGELVKQ